MILKELYLYPDLVDFDDGITRAFRDQSRSMCNYLERQLKSIRFDAVGFKRICFVGKSDPSSECSINSSNVLIVEVRFDEEEYRTREKDQVNTFFLEMIRSGIKKCQEQHRVPANDLLERLAEPFNALDEESVLEMRQILRSFVEQGRTLVMTSHQREDIEFLCDEVYRLRRGRVESVT